MGIPGLINAIGTGERISLSKLAIGHLERTQRPIRIAVDISIWLFQVQAGRGGRNPELRTLFYRLLKFLALPVHPLFVYDGKHKPPFKRGKATTSSYGSAPIIGLSKTLVDLFRFPRHEAPGEAEAECARLQRAGIVDAVMSNDVDALMFGSTWTVMNYSRESGSSGSGATHVTCYEMDNPASSCSSRLDRAGMILFAMLSGGDYLPSGVPKCGSKLAAEIARAGFGADLLDALDAEESHVYERLNEWRERLQYELEENESGYFQTKHKAVRIPQTFPDRTILSFYAKPVVSGPEDIGVLQNRLLNAWDQDVDPSKLRRFTANAFDWKYRSGARKLIKLLAEPLTAYRLRLGREVLAFPFRLSENDVPMLQKVYKSRSTFNTDGLTELQLDYVPIDVVGLDLLAEEPNPPMAPQEPAASGDEEDDADPNAEANAEPVSPETTKKRVTKRFDPYASEKIWVFEVLATIGIPEVVQSWKRAQSEKASAPKKPSSRRTGPKKKGPIDPGMKRGSILKYGTLTKERSDISQFRQAQLFDAAISSKPQHGQPIPASPGTLPASRGLSSHSSYSQQHLQTLSQDQHFDNPSDIFSSPCTISPNRGVKQHPMARRSAVRSSRGAVLSGGTEVEVLDILGPEPLDCPASPISPGRIRVSYSNANYNDLAVETANVTPSPSPVRATRRNMAMLKLDSSPSPSPSPKPAEKPQKSTLVTNPDNSEPQTPIKSQPKTSKTVTPIARRQPQKPQAQKSKSNTTPSPDHKPSTPETKSPSKVQAILEQMSLDMRTLHLKDPNQPSHTPKTTPREKDTPEPKTSSTVADKPKDEDPNTLKTISHVEDIVTNDGYWTVEPTPEPDQSNPTTRRTRKRYPRVSIVDLT
ncbi:hypothetical protein BDV25DRAFT_123055 [Aspergillus avenaceus]|uniref:Rad2-like endonuclease n=1 Tax=Aspergillus avenaceus TaxID=36643 RepID=A0A5N6TUI6_ASPAV|nr:hypothetical protein BDV25DRAFT_123055 [Aspergillus avenaceus]